MQMSDGRRRNTILERQNQFLIVLEYPLMKFAKTVCTGLAMLVCAGWSLAQDNAPFQYKLKKGEKYVYQRETQVKQSQTIKDMKPIQTEITQNDVSVLTVEDAKADGQLTLKSQTKELSVKLEVAGQKFAYDSK